MYSCTTFLHLNFKSMSKFFPGFFALIFFSQTSFATTLEEAIESAKINNKNLKVEDYRLEATKSLKGEAMAEFLPSVSASGQYGERKSNNTSSVNGGNQKYNSNRVEELKAEQPLFNGFGSIAKYNEADY